jgi:hypothetical protein
MAMATDGDRPGDASEHVETRQIYRGGALAGTAVTLGGRLKFFAGAPAYADLDGAIFEDLSSLNAALDRRAPDPGG